MHDDLLELADHLVRQDPARPKQVSLRRAISTAYYALFHALAFLCADTLIGWTKSWEAVTPIYRSLDHGSAKRLFELDRNGTMLGKDVSVIGQVFIFLQQLRHTVDYDPRPLSLARSEVIELIGRARMAIELTRTIAPETRLLLAVHLVARKR